MSKTPIQQVFYKLTELNAEVALNNISVLTNNFDTKYQIEPKFIDNLRHNLQNRGITLHGFLYDPPDADIIKMVIGRGGCYFYKTTLECGIDFIWHNRDKKRFEFWGPKFSVIRAMDIIRHRIVNSQLKVQVNVETNITQYRDVETNITKEAPVFDKKVFVYNLDVAKELVISTSPRNFSQPPVNLPKSPKIFAREEPKKIVKKVWAKVSN